MGRKKLVMLLVSMALLIGVFAVIGVAITSTTETNMEADAESGTDMEPNAGLSENNKKTDASSGDQEAAKALIDETVSRDEIKDSVGEWDKFEMDGNGCERGVYAGRFYYGDFTIYSRTYDKGETFHIMSVNE